MINHKLTDDVSYMSLYTCAKPISDDLSWRPSFDFNPSFWFDFHGYSDRSSSRRELDRFQISRFHIFHPRIRFLFTNISVEISINDDIDLCRSHEIKCLSLSQSIKLNSAIIYISCMYMYMYIISRNEPSAV